MAILIRKLALVEKKCEMQELCDKINGNVSNPIVDSDLRKKIVELMNRAGVTSI